MTTTSSKIQKARRAFDQAIADLKAVNGEYRTARDAIRADPDLTDEAKARNTHTTRKTFEAEQAARQENAIEALADYLALLEFTANPPVAAGVEGIAERVEAADARSRVRFMLDRGTDPAKILARAVSLGDLTALEALKAEAKWINAGTEHAENGRRVDVLPEALLKRIDLARADLIGGERGEAIRESLTMADQKQAWADKILRAPSELGNGPTLASAVSDHFSGIGTPPGDAGGSGEGEAA